MRWNRRCSVLVAVAVLATGMAATVVATAGLAVAASVTVTNCDDSGPGTLRQAVVDAASGDTIAFASPLGCNVITLTTGEILIDKNLTISGPGATELAVSGNSSSRVFNVGGSRTVVISGLTVSGGKATSGGGILTGNSSSLTLTATTVTGNTAFKGGGISPGLGSSLTLSGSTVTNNIATVAGLQSGGGGIFLYTVRATVSRSTVSGNTAVGDGGGIHNDSSALTVTESDVSGNTARFGGGIYVFGTGTTVSASTVSGNIAVVGGGVYNTGGFVTVSTSTVADNQATGNATFPGRGGGIYDGGTSSSVRASTITGNTATSGGGIYTALASGSGHIVSGSIITDGCGSASSSYRVIDGGYNLDVGSTCVNPAAPATGSVFDTPAGLGAAGLAANGGPTRTIALAAGSAAIGKIPNGVAGLCPRTDQRGIASASGGACDAGAFQTESVLCEAGSFSATGSSPCTPAPPGSFVVSAGSTLATPCPPGRYQDQSGQSSCLPAPPGTFVNTAGAASATPCPTGYFSALPASLSCSPAPAGSFVDTTGATSATPCPAGKYSSTAASLSCTSSPAGSFVSSSGSTSATLCPPGHFAAGVGATACTRAPAGSFVASSGAASATLCPPGSFASASASLACTPAPAGSFVTLSGAIAANLCQPGSYSPLAGSVSCIPAPIGSYVDTPGASSAKPCPPGTTTTVAGQSTCAPVLAPQTISFNALADKLIGAAPFAVSADATSTLTVGFSSLTPSVCTVTGTNVTLQGALGACTIRATQPGNTAWKPATAVDRTFKVIAGVRVFLPANLSIEAGNSIPVLFVLVDANNKSLDSSIGRTASLSVSFNGGPSIAVRYDPRLNVFGAIVPTLRTLATGSYPLRIASTTASTPVTPTIVQVQIKADR